MVTPRIPVTGGPDKADLLRAVANPDEHLHATFGTPDGLLEAHIDAIEERGIDGVGTSRCGGTSRRATCAGPISPARTTVPRGPAAWP